MFPAHVGMNRLFYDHELLDVQKAEERLSSQVGTAASPGSTPLPSSTRLNEYAIRFSSQGQDQLQGSMLLA